MTTGSSLGTGINGGPIYSEREKGEKYGFLGLIIKFNFEYAGLYVFIDLQWDLF